MKTFGLVYYCTLFQFQLVTSAKNSNQKAKKSFVSYQSSSLFPQLQPRQLYSTTCFCFFAENCDNLGRSTPFTRRKYHDDIVVLPTKYYLPVKNSIVFTTRTITITKMNSENHNEEDDNNNEINNDTTSPRRSGRKRTPTTKHDDEVIKKTSDHDKSTSNMPTTKKSKNTISKSSSVKKITNNKKEYKQSTDSMDHEENKEEVDNNITKMKSNNKKLITKASSTKKSENAIKKNEKTKSVVVEDNNENEYVNETQDTTIFNNDTNNNDKEILTTKKPTKKINHQVLTERSFIPKLWNNVKTDDTDTSTTASSSSYTFKIGSWNVAGLRAILKNNPDSLDKLVQRHNLDVLCLQETKLQDIHLDDPKLQLRGVLLANGYDSYYSCSTAKKGYSGTAVFIKRRDDMKPQQKPQQQKTINSFFSSTKKEDTTVTDSNVQKAEAATNGGIIDYTNLIPNNVTYTMGIDKHDQEGRLVIVEFPLFTLCNVYVPNSGQNLERLQYRINEWDKDFISFLKHKQDIRGLPIIWTGDLNIAHTNLEVWNNGAKHLDKQAGVTPEERKSFQEQLNYEDGYIDAFRKLHPNASGHYTYWSVRAGNRQPNKGLRLDYFICDPILFSKNDSDSSSKNVIVRDCYMDYEQIGSDHCPIIMEMEIKL